MTGGWAATNTLREFVARTPDTATMYKVRSQSEADAALALVETALDLGDELRLWQPGRKGYAAAQERFFAALRAAREGA